MKYYVHILTTDTITGFGVQNIGATSTTSYMQLTPKNYFIGHESGKSITSGKYNSFIGYQSGYNDTSGYKNYFIGYKSGFSNTNGFSNIFIGDSTGFNNTGPTGTTLPESTYGCYNIFVGNQCGYSNTTGRYNIAIGQKALYSNINGEGNTVVGKNALYSNTTGTSNTVFGYNAMYENISGYKNTATGYLALNINTTGYQNTANGHLAMFNNSTGRSNTGIGDNALYSNTTGTANTALGGYAYYTGTYERSTALGYNATITDNNQVRIGDAPITSIGGFANWTNVSDIRFKKDVNDSVPGLAFILKLRPVTYHLNLDAIATALKTQDKIRSKDSEKLKSEMLQTGFIAQDVEKAAKELGYDFSGVDKPKNEKDYYGLRYAEFTVPLVKAVQELNSKNEELTKENEVMKIKLQELENLKAENLQMKEDIENIKSMLNYSTKK